MPYSTPPGEEDLEYVSEELPDPKSLDSYFGYGPLTVTVVNEGLQGSPTKNVIILVVTVTVRGPHPTYINDY